ncbi:hypothetical protein ACFFLS_16460 [Flavobacterium procerum]|uniref:Uncharacterized protein n=1 Tax=Flavobacterium procerum TaxID=1455569 RepID=A0ABV6BUE4_9FLAO
MKNFSDFIAHNRSAFFVGLFCFGIYMYFTLAGNRICDCETTEKYRTTPSARRSTISSHHFYHK